MMKIVHIMELVLLSIITILFSILTFKLIHKLRSILPWRVNCWFCNNNFWIKFPYRNCWNCPKCEQYNGFTKEGDYNKPIITTNDQTSNTPRVFQKSPSKNGLCKMCNINQQLKVAQLASFVPINEKKFDEEIEMYRLQLEKAYKLCSPCKRLLQQKLHKEKETLLATKLLENRYMDKSNQMTDKQNVFLKTFVNNTSKHIAGLLLFIVLVELCVNIQNHKYFPDTLINVKQIISGLLERIISIVKMKTLMTFPSIENYHIDLNIIYNKWPKTLNLMNKESNYFILLTQEALGGFVCFLQIIGHIYNVSNQKHVLLIDLLWSVFVVTSMAHHVTIDPVYMSLFKAASLLTMLLIYKSMKKKLVKSTRVQTTPKKMMNLINGSPNLSLDDDDTLAFDSDDDVSLNKFGLHSFSDSSNETSNNNSFISGRSFTPKVNGIWTKPKQNSTYCVNSVICKSPSSVSDTVFAKPSFNKYQKLIKDDSDSDLDESISSLCIGAPKKLAKNNPVFSLKQFNPTPTFVTPTPINRARPLISPSKLGHSTSWVAGGYWGSEGERQIFNINGSRSSSQSSGFESQASSMNQRNVFSQPSSREESICGEPMVIDNQMPNYNSFQFPQNFARVSSPVFPQMQYNSHVHIPQPRFAQHNNVAHSVFAQHQFVQNKISKTPGGPGLMKLPQVNSFAPN